MLALRFTFPAGRCHATPWGRHVNEGEVAWPPEPWRLLRALIATWHHKLARSGRFGKATLAALIENLAIALPAYTLPPASHSHTRHYLPQWKAGDTSLVFDAFAAVARDEPLYCFWPDLELPDEQAALLDTLLENLVYLGRAESWVEARRVENPPPANCLPGQESVDPETGEVRGEVIELLASVSADEYRSRRARFLADQKQTRKLAVSLPEGLLDALCVDNAELQKCGWNQPPAARQVFYLRPIDALRPARKVRKAVPPGATTARFLLVGKPLPRVEDTLRIGELLRQAVMSRAKRTFGEDAVPAVLSGHGMPTDNRHGHAFYLPWDADGDGRLDHVLIHVSAGIDSPSRLAIEGLRKIWQPGGSEWRLVFEAIGYTETGAVLTAEATVWRSLTPYLHPWHIKKRFMDEDQIRRECRERGLPVVANLERFPAITINGRERRPVHFHRFRAKRGLVQPDTRGSFWRIEFAEPVQGPLALGFACHFGLGLFGRAD